MSGLEIVGVVLGSIPILLKAVEGLGNTAQTSRFFSKKRLYVRKLANALYEHNQCLAGTVRLLLTRSGYDDISFHESDVLAVLQSEDVQEHIKECLGTENYGVFMATLGDSAGTISSMTKDLQGLTPSVAGPIGNLYAIIQACQGSHGMDVVSRLKFVFHASSMKKITEELDATTVRLERFVRFLTPDGPLVKGQASPKAKRIAKGLLRIRDFTRNLHAAIGHGWSDGCHSEHDAKFILDDQLDSGLISSKSFCQPVNEHYLEFRLALFANSPGDGGCETSILVLRKDAEGDSNCSPKPNVLPSSFTCVTFTTPDFEAPKDPVTTVRNLCLAARTVAMSAKPISFVLTSGPRLGTIPSTKRTFVPHTNTNEISLEELIEAADRREQLMPMKSRVMLALKLASNLPQLLQTPWLRSGWSSRMICFALSSGFAESMCRRVDFTKPFISSTFKQSHVPHSSEGDVTPEVAFLELGIVLLEIWHQKPIEAQFPDEIIPDDYYCRMTLASRWRKESLDPPLELYDQAIRYCIFGLISSPTPTPQWNDKQLWSSYCGEVVEPLYQSCKSWRGG